MMGIEKQLFLLTKKAVFMIDSYHMPTLLPWIEPKNR